MKLTILQKQSLINNIPANDLFEFLTENGWTHCEYCNELINSDDEGWDTEKDCCNKCSLAPEEDNPAVLTKFDLGVE